MHGFVMKKNVIIITDFPPSGKFLLPSGFLHPAAQIALEIFLLDRLALVVELFARTQGHLDLDKPAIVEIDPGGHQNQTALGRVTEDLFDLLLVEQEPPRPLGLLIKVTGLPVGFNIEVIQGQLAFGNPGKTVFEIDMPRPDGLDLPAFKLNAAFPAVGEGVIPERLLVGRDRLSHNGVDYSNNSFRGQWI